MDKDEANRGRAPGGAGGLLFHIEVLDRSARDSTASVKASSNPPSSSNI